MSIIVTSRDKRALHRAAEDAVDRVKRDADPFSRQPRLTEGLNRTFGNLYGWARTLSNSEPEWDVTNSRQRDRWLRDTWKLETHLKGVLNTVTTLDKNRGWSFLGGRNQVLRYQKIAWEAEAGDGWRQYFGVGSLSYWTSDLGFVNENGRDGEGGPLRAIYNVDPVRCQLTGDPDFPLTYTPSGRHKPQKWMEEDFFRAVSMKSNNEEQHGLGYCAVSRCIELAKVMVAIYDYDNERLGAKAPTGLLLLHNVGETQWEDAMKMRKAELEGLEKEWFGGVAVLASTGIEQIDAKMVALSQLPDQFNRETFVELLMAAYALVFGYDPAEFWPIAASGLGRSEESDVQHTKATRKGPLDFILAFQDGFQKELPDTLQFEFESRDTEGEILEAQVALAKSAVPKSLYETGLQAGLPLISREEARIMLAEEGIIPREWTEYEEEVEGTDTDIVDGARMRDKRDELLANPYVLRSVARFPDEPLIRYRWPADKFSLEWESGHSLLQRMWFPSAVPNSGRRTRARLNGKHVPALVIRQEEEDTVLYEDGDVVITVGDADRAIEEGIERNGEEYADLYEPHVLTDEELAILDEGGTI